MKNLVKEFLLCAWEDTRGQVLPWMTLLVVLFLGMAGLTVDLGRAYVCYRELKASTDAAALAGVYAMSVTGATPATVKSEACSFSSNTSPSASCPAGTNTTPNLPNVSTTPTLTCVAAAFAPVACGAVPALAANSIRVTQTAVIPTLFIQALGAFGINSAKTLTLNAVSSAALSGSTPPIRLAIVLDTTNSMSQQDPACGMSKIQCALKGVRQLLSQLPPCAEVNSSGTCVAYNQVSLFTFPNVNSNDLGDDTSCPSSNPQIQKYYTPPIPQAPTPGQTPSWTPPSGGAPTYQITGYLQNYIQSGTTLSTSSPLSVAAGAGGCQGLQTPGGDGTFYAGAIYAAQTSLMAATAGTNAQPVMIILSDGDAQADSAHINDTSSQYGTASNECQQAINAAQTATQLGTTVYSIAYGASTQAYNKKTAPGGSCSTDSGLSGCATMQQMSTGWNSNPQDTSHFYSDLSTGVGTPPSGCTASGPVGLPEIFSAIQTQLSRGRLVPNS